MTVLVQDKVELKRELGLFSAVNMIIAVMIGSGIFVSPTSALVHSGSVGFCLIIWAVSGLVSLLGALAFAELGTVVPRSGAEYVYLLEAFDPTHRYFGQLPAFICAWVYIFVLRPAEVAVVVLTFSEYIIQPLSPFMGGVSPQSMYFVIKFISIAALGLMTYINMTSVQLYIKVQNIVGVCKVAACALIIGGGVVWLGSGRTELLKDPFKGTTTSLGDIALAFYSGLWAYDGWTSATIVSEEVKKPEVNILRSILISVPLVTVFYVAMNLMYMSVLTLPEMAGATAVAVSWAERALPVWLRVAIPIGVALATFGCGISMQFGVSRLCYVAGQEGHVPMVFSFIHIEKFTPAAAVALQGLITLAFILAGNINSLIELASFLTWAFYGSAMCALLVLRRNKPDVPRPYRVPTFVPWLVLFISAFLAIMPIVKEPSPKYAFAGIFILVGVAIYHQYVYRKRKNSLMDKFTRAVQVLCLVAPPDKRD